MLKSINKIGKKGFEALTTISPNFSAKILFLIRTKTWPNLKNPTTFNEKSTWIKMNVCPNNELISKCTDKYAVREYIEQKGCKELLNELYGVYNNFDEINFDELPDKFALKCTHGCTYNIICSNKSELDINVSRKKMNAWMKEKYGKATSELHYLNIEPRIIAEKYLCKEDGRMPTDYKFYCSRGKVLTIFVCTDRKYGHEMNRNFFNTDWEKEPFLKAGWKAANNIPRPKGLKKMIKYAKRLSQDFDLVRVDLYDDDGIIIFGELTFTPACCCPPYLNNKGDEQLGKALGRILD